MSEQEIRDGLKLAVADEPPMTFDLDDLMDTAERHARRRRALIAVGASTAAVAIAAVAVPVMLGIGGGPAEIPVAAPPSHATATATLPPKKPGLTRAQLVARGAEMQAHLDTRFPVVVPGAKQVRVGLFSGEAEGVVEDGQNYLGSFLRFTLAAPTAIEVQVRDDQDKDRTCSGAGCVQIPQQDGSLVVVSPAKLGQERPAEMMIKSAVHFRNDGTSVRVTAYNYDPTSQNGMIFQEDVSLTVDQLTTLAVDPALHM